MTDTPEGSPAPAQTPSVVEQPAGPAGQSTWLTWILIGEVALIICLLIGRQSPATITSTPEWEYLVQVDYNLNQTGGLVQRGKEKWELVTLKGEQTQTYYFKRAKSAQNPQTAKVVFPSNRWSGRIDANLAKQPIRPVKGPKSLASLWHSFKQPGEPPPLDFSKELVFAASTPGTHVDIVPVLYHGGNLKLTFSFGAINPQAQDGSFVIVVVPRKFSDNDGDHVIKSVNGSPVPNPGPED